jgi:hypothetical protein
MLETNLIKLRIDAAIRGKWNIGFFAAGLIFWIFIGVISNVLPLEKARFHMIAGTFLIFPMAVLFSKIFKADPFTKGNAIGELIGYTHMSVIALSFPIVIVTATYLPTALILVMAILNCLDFYVMSWGFGTNLFALHAAFRTILVTVLYFVIPTYKFIIIPVVLALFYLSTLILIPILRAKWLTNNEADN